LDCEAIFSLAEQRGWLRSMAAAVQLSAHYSKIVFDKEIINPDVMKRATDVHLKSYLENEIHLISKGNAITDFPIRFFFKTNLKLWYSKIFSDSVIPFTTKFQQASASSIRTLKRKMTGYRRIQPAYYIGNSGIDGSAEIGSQTDTLQGFGGEVSFHKIADQSSP